MRFRDMCSRHANQDRRSDVKQWRIDAGVLK